MHRESTGICSGLVDSIGNMPLIRLKRLSEMTGCDILGKVEFMNPGGSVKDRAALRQPLLHGILPEPLRTAHLLAEGVIRGESAGRA